MGSLTTKMRMVRLDLEQVIGGKDAILLRENYRDGLALILPRLWTGLGRPAPVRAVRHDKENEQGRYSKDRTGLRRHCTSHPRRELRILGAMLNGHLPLPKKRTRKTRACSQALRIVFETPLTPWRLLRGFPALGSDPNGWGGWTEMPKRLGELMRDVAWEDGLGADPRMGVYDCEAWVHE